jgi:hypothetical protein
MHPYVGCGSDPSAGHVGSVFCGELYSNSRVIWRTGAGARGIGCSIVWSWETWNYELRASLFRGRQARISHGGRRRRGRGQRSSGLKAGSRSSCRSPRHSAVSFFLISPNTTGRKPQLRHVATCWRARDALLHGQSSAAQSMAALRPAGHIAKPLHYRAGSGAAQPLAAGGGQESALA